MRAPAGLTALVLLTTMAAGCGGARAPARVTPAPPAASAWPVAPVPQAAEAVLRTALAQLGRPYRNGGRDPRGFDCSGFVQFVFGRHGVALPRSVAAQYARGTPVDLRAVRAGDLLFFATGRGGVTHVAIALADGRFIHAPSGRGVVRVEVFAGRYWPRRFVGARRVLGPGRSAG